MGVTLSCFFASVGKSHSVGAFEYIFRKETSIGTVFHDSFGDDELLILDFAKLSKINASFR